MLPLITLLSQAGLLIATGVGAITDAKTGYIYDWITYPAIALGLVLSVATCILSGVSTNLIIGGILFVSLYAMYYFGKIGGGDVKLFVAIALLNPTQNAQFLFTILLFATASAITFYSVYYTIKYFRKGINVVNEREGIIKAILIGAAVTLLYFFGGLSTMLLNPIATLFGIPLVTGLIYVALEKGIKEQFFYVTIKTKTITEDEIIVPERLSNKAALLLRGTHLVGEKEAALLTKNKITTITVLRNLPVFGPFIFVGVVLTLLNPFVFSFFFP